MKISNFPTAQELFKQLEDLSKDDQRPAEAGTTTPAALPVSDSFEKAVPTADQAESGNLQQESGGLRIAYHFDLFYQLSQQIQTKMGQSGQERFVETSSKVAEAFKGNFSLQIDGVGSFLKGTDSSLKISNETTNQFLDSVNNLADLSPEALSSFLEKSDTFFNELEKQYGESGGAFDEIKAQMQEQARNFFDGVKTIQDESGLGAEFFGGDSTGTEAEGTGQTAAAAQLPQSSETDSGAPDVTLAVGPQQGTQVSANQYQAFVESFLQYTLRFKQSIFSTMLSSGQSSPQSALSSTVPSSSSDAVKSTQATMLDKLSQALHPDTPNGKFPTGYFPASDNAASSLLSRLEPTDTKSEKTGKPVKSSKLDTSA